MAAARFECPRCQTVFVKDIAGDAAFVECPSCGALALPAGDATDSLTAAVSGGDGGKSIPSTDDGAAADPSASSAGMFSNLLDSARSLPDAVPVDDSTVGTNDARAAAAAAAARVQGSAKAPELDFDFGVDIDIPVAPDAPPPSMMRGGSRSMEASTGRSTEGPAVHSLPPEALAALAAEADSGPTDGGKKPAPWSGLSEEAFGDLEKAFDEMALKPGAPPPRGSSGLSVDEERFLRGDESAESGPVGRAPPPLRRVDGEERTARNQSGARPPPRGASGQNKREKRPRPSHFELSTEAKSLAFHSLNGEGSVSMSRQRMMAEARGDADVSGSTSRPRPPLEARDVRPAQPTHGAGPEIEETDLVAGRAAKDAKAPPKKKVPSALGGLTFLRVAALILGTTILGGVGGALTAPKPKLANTARARAELQFATGNRFYDAGRYDDALGAFRGALSIDPTYALAHRAKGAALAKLSRFDESAEAYDEYLKLDPNAVDASDVKNAIVRRRGDEKPK